MIWYPVLVIVEILTIFLVAIFSWIFETFNFCGLFLFDVLTGLCWCIVFFFFRMKWFGIPSFVAIENSELLLFYSRDWEHSFNSCHCFIINVLTDLGWHAAEKQLMLRVAELIPKHHGRTKKQEPANTSTAAGSSKSGKGGKKKKWSSIRSEKSSPKHWKNDGWRIWCFIPRLL